MLTVFEQDTALPAGTSFPFDFVFYLALNIKENK